MNRFFYLCCNLQSVVMRVLLVMGLAVELNLVLIGGPNLWASPPEDDFFFQSQLCTKSVIFGDFDGNGFEDLAIGCSALSGSSIAGAGAVYVFYSEASGLTSLRRDVWHLDSPSIDGEADEHDVFGAALAVGDFNGDEVDDLVIGAPGTDENRGQVNIIFGSLSNGLTSAGNRRFIFDSNSRFGFGEALAVGDFDADGRDDLVVGVPGFTQTFGGSAFLNEGGVKVFYGDGDRETLFQSHGVEGELEADDNFGKTLAVGDFNGDGVDDLAIGVPDEDFNGYIYDDDNVGIVHVVYGARSLGLQRAFSQIWHQDSDGIKGEAEQGDHFGAALAAGDFNGDGVDDLAIGVPGEHFESFLSIDSLYSTAQGAVNVIYGKPISGLDKQFDQIWHLDKPGIEGSVKDWDFFGVSLAAGDLNGDGVDDLAIGAHRKDVDDIGAAGTVNIIFGSDGSRLRSEGDLMIHQNTIGILGEPELGDFFGQALAIGHAGDPNANPIGRFADLAVSVRDGGGKGDGEFCAANVIYGSNDGVTPIGNQQWLCENMSLLDQLLNQINHISSFRVKVDGGFTDKVGEGEWSDVQPSAFSMDAPLVATATGNPSADSLIFAAIAPNAVTADVENLYLMFAFLPRTNPEFEPDDLIAAISFPITNLNGGTHNQIITVQIFSSAVSVTSPGIDIFVDLDGDSRRDIPAKDLGIEAAVNFGPSPLSDVDHLLVELTVPLSIVTGFADPDSPLPREGLTGIYPPGPAFWTGALATDTARTIPRPTLASSFMLWITPDASVNTNVNVIVERIVEINIMDDYADGTLPVVILTTVGFDTTSVIPTTVVLANPADPKRIASPFSSGIADVDDDGDTDIVLYFSIQDLVDKGVLTENSTSAALIGRTVLGEAIGGTDEVIVKVEYNEPPFCTKAFASAIILWPPNGRFEPIKIANVLDPDGDTVSINIDAILQDEPVNEKDYRNTCPDGKGVNSSTAKVRVERSDMGDGRVYHILYTANDGNGGTCTGQVRVRVPHDRDSKIVDGGALFNSTKSLVYGYQEDQCLNKNTTVK